MVGLPEQCVDRTAGSDFLFRLQPGELERFLPLGGTGRFATTYQVDEPADWPHWGSSDLDMGYPSKYTSNLPMLV
jgi:hypothetical protein